MQPFIFIGSLLVRRSTPPERAVLLFTGVIILVGFGLACLYFGSTAAPDKAAEAAELRFWGFVLIGSGFGLWGLYRLAGWVADQILG